MPTVVISRDRSFAGAAVPYRVSVDSAEVGRFRVGRTLTLEVPPGSHLLEVHSGGAQLCSGRVEAGQAYLLAHPRIGLRALPRALWCGLQPRLVMRAPAGPDTGPVGKRGSRSRARPWTR